MSNQAIEPKNQVLREGDIVKYARALQPGDEQFRFLVVNVGERLVSIALMDSGMFVDPIELVSANELEVCAS